MPMHLLRAREDGVAALIVAFLFGAGVFVALLALVIDVGMMRLERRELQNGADAAVVQAAYDCSMQSMGSPTSGCGSLAQPISIASANASDGLATISPTGICGVGPNLSPCPAPSAKLNCPTLTTNYVQVTTSTLAKGASPYLPQIFSSSLMAPRAISACSRATWGAPGSMDLSVPFTVGKACWEQQLSKAGNVMPANPPYTGFSSGVNPEPWNTYESTFVFGKDTVGPAGSCRLTAVTPGGFGWLDASSDACALTLQFGQSSSDTGKSQSSAACSDKMFSHLNATLSGNTTTPAFFNRISYIPIYDTMSGTPGTNGSYHIAGFAAFYMTAFQAPALSKKVDPRKAANACGPQLACVYGWFVNSTIVAPNAVPTGDGQQAFGLNVVNLIG